ncbi:sugar-binding transcriptional regulator [Streptomyces shenzhenensis]|nr:sugar-binding domain-containing protein [Streptomyces shenzhenensis]
MAASAWESLRAARAAHLHYVEGLRVTQVAEHLGVSRFKAGRLIQTAREQGLVHIEITPPPLADPTRSAALLERYAPHGLTRALVVPAQAGRAALNRAAAEAVEEATRPGDVLGLACGRTVNQVVAALRRLPDCDVVQLTGLTTPGDVNDSSVETIRRASRLTRSTAVPVYVPMVLPSLAEAAALRVRPALAKAFARLDRLTVALITVGAWQPGDSNLHDSTGLADSEREAATRRGVVAEFAGHLVDADGRTVATDLTDRCLVVPLERLRHARDVVAIAAAVRRASAVDAALRSGLIHTLVTDTEVADAFLAHRDTAPTEPPD